MDCQLLSMKDLVDANKKYTNDIRKTLNKRDYESTKIKSEFNKIRIIIKLIMFHNHH